MGSEDLAPYGDPGAVRTVGVLGTGSVGSSWVTFALARGFDVLARDPREDAPRTVDAFVEAAWPSMVGLGLTDRATPAFERLRFVASEVDLAPADLVFEATLERLEPKIAALRALDAVLAPSTIIATSTGGMRVTDLQAQCRHPGRIVLFHPLNPAHVIPLVEVCGGEQTDPQAVQWALEFCRRHGKAPVHLRREIVGHLSNRLQAALLREAVHCLVEGYASPADIDTVVTMGLGARWAVVGPLMTTHLAGGPGGTAAILAHAGDAMDQWWAALGDISLTPTVRERMIEASEELGGLSAIPDLVRERDEGLVRVFRETAPRPGPSRSELAGPGEGP